MGDIASGQLVHLRLFLEGLEIPCISASVSISLGGPAAANIEIIPIDRALSLLPRTIVHVFYLDYQEARFAPEFEPEAPPNVEVFAEEGLSVPIDRHYKLLFMGELFSVSFSKSGVGSRSITLSCLDFSNMWDTNYIYNLRYESTDPSDGQGSGLVGDQSKFVNTTATTSSSVENYPAKMIQGIMEGDQSANNPGLSDTGYIVGSVFKVLEIVGGVQGKWVGVNAWTTIEERRVRLMDQLGSDSGESAEKLFARQVFTAWITDQLGAQGGVLSFRDLVAMVNNYVYYDVVANPVGRYIPGDNSIPDWASIDAVGAAWTGAVSSGTKSTLEIDEVTGVKQKKAERQGLNAWFRQRVDRVEYDLVHVYNWNGSENRPLPIESSLLRRDPTSRSKHAIGLAADLVLDGLATGFRGDSTLFSGGYATDSSTMYGRLHQHFANGGVNDPATAADLANLEAYSSFFHDYRAAARAHGLRSGADFRGNGVKTDENGTQYTQGIDYSTKPPGTFREYVWCSVGLGWDPVHMEAPYDSVAETPAPDPDPPPAPVVVSEETPPPLDGPFSDPDYTLSRTERRMAAWGDGGYYGVETPDKTPPTVPTAASPVDIASADMGPPTDAKGPANIGSGAFAEGEARPREKLVTQIFRPDVWFVPPPVCNVLFPEEYVTFSFSRQMMREATRLQLTTFNSLYEDAVVNQYYFAPHLNEGESLSVGALGSAAKSLIYPHEKFSGVIPKMERINDVSFYQTMAAPPEPPKDPQQDGDPADAGSSQKPKQLSTEQKGTVEKYAGAVAAYNFLSHRYESRSAQIMAKFVPRVVCGFPMLVLNKPVTRGFEPLHFLGIVVSLSHSVSQDGATSQIQLAKARTHRSDTQTDDLFSAGIALQQQRDEGTQVSTEITLTAGQVLNPMEMKWVQVGMRMLNNESAAPARASAVPSELDLETRQSTQSAEDAQWAEMEATSREADAAAIGTRDKPSELLPTGPNNGRIVQVVISNDNRVETPIRVYYTSYSQNRTDSMGSDYLDLQGHLDVPFSAMTLVETVGEHNIPLEEAIRPPWFSEEYSNARIGKEIYGKLFGCESIADIGLTPPPGYEVLGIEAATDEIARKYTSHANADASAEAFIWGFTRRVYAALPDVLGSFHKNAFGDVGGLQGLDIVGVPLTMPLGDPNSTDPEHPENMAQMIDIATAEALDPRKDRRKRVRDYLAELLQSQGIRG